MKRLVTLLLLFAGLIVGCDQRPRTPSDDEKKVKVKVNTPGVNVEVEGKKK